MTNDVPASGVFCCGNLDKTLIQVRQNWDLMRWRAEPRFAQFPVFAASLPSCPLSVLARPVRPACCMSLCSVVRRYADESKYGAWHHRTKGK